MSKVRIIINSWDDKSFNQIINLPLAELIEAAQETGECLCVYNNNIHSFIRKTKTGYSITTYDRNNRNDMENN